MTRKKEPGSLAFWVIVVLLVFVIVPYPFMGESEPRLWNIPVWFYVSLGASTVVAALSAWRIWSAWRLADDDE
jgi:protein-S-isoprenylcysteine O-methyltransferase Ste14